MPPKAKITKDMIINAGFEIVRQEVESALNVRRIAAKLNCSTQPVMYHYSTVNDLKADVYTAVDKFHTQFILNPSGSNPMLAIGLNYIRFATEEKYLFRFLFQSDKFSNAGFQELMHIDSLDLILHPLSEQTGLSSEQAREAFETLFICVHGYASLLANNSMIYDEIHCQSLLTSTFMGIIGYMRRNEDEKAF